MTNNVPLSTTSAICLAVVFCSFLTVSIVSYPRPWSPLTTYLSDFGNMKLSPIGSLFYNAGCIMTGTAVGAFYIGMSDWEADDRRRLLLGAARVLGIASGVALALIGLYSEDYPSLHRFWSFAFFTLNFFSIILVNAALVGRRDYGRPTMIFGFGLSIVTIVSFLTWGGTPSVEWFTVFASMTFAVLLGYDSHRKNLRKRASTSNN
jgi:hypothetical membrane protein